jgi:hypothetical protein
VDHDPDNRAVVSDSNWLDDLRSRLLAIDHDPPPQTFQRGWWRMTVKECLVFLVDLVSRMHNPVCNLAVIRQ